MKSSCGDEETAVAEAQEGAPSPEAPSWGRLYNGPAPWDGATFMGRDLKGGEHVAWFGGNYFHCVCGGRMLDRPVFWRPLTAEEVANQPLARCPAAPPVRHRWQRATA